MQTGEETQLAFRRKFVIALVVAISVLFFYMVRGFFEALVLAAVFGALARPLYLVLLEKFGSRQALASATTLVVALVGVIIPVLYFLDILAGQAADIVAKLSPWIDAQIESAGSSAEVLPEWVPFREQLEPYGDSISTKLAELASSIGEWLVSSLSAATRGTASFFLSLFVMLYAMYFYLISGPQMMRRAMDYLPLVPADRDKIIEVARSVSMATVKGTIIIGAVQGILSGGSLALAGIPGAAFWAAFIAVMSIIPGIGPSIVWGPVVIFLAFKGEYFTAGALLVWNGAVVGTIDNILRPRLVGKDTKMPDLLILLSTLGGLTLFGASGIIIGPVIAGLFLTIWMIYGRVFKDSLNAPSEE